MSAVRYSAATKADALRQVHAMQGQGYSRRGAVQQVAARLGCRSETLNAWLRRDAIQQRGLGDAHDPRIQRLEREVQQLMQTNAALRRELERLERRARAADVDAVPAASAELRRAWAPPSGRR